MGLEKRIVAMFMMSSTICESVVPVSHTARAEGVDRSAGLYASGAPPFAGRPDTVRIGYASQ